MRSTASTGRPAATWIRPLNIALRREASARHRLQATGRVPGREQLLQLGPVAGPGMTLGVRSARTLGVRSARTLGVRSARTLGVKAAAAVVSVVAEGVEAEGVAAAEGVDPVVTGGADEAGAGVEAVSAHWPCFC